jgi:hypothetical protein
MRPALLIVAAFAALLVAAPAGASAGGGVWAGCDGRAELVRPAKVEHCSHDVTYAVYVDNVAWATFGSDQATGIGSAYANPCDVSCDYGVWFATGSASVTLSRPRACGDRRIYTHGLIQLQNAYAARTVFEENYPCTQVIRQCAGSTGNGALRAIEQRATTCAKARALARRWAQQRSTRVGAYRCSRRALKLHQALVTCTASRQRYVRFSAVRG